MSMAETASNISAQAEADPISDFRINEKSVVPIWIQIRKRLVYLISSGKFERGERLHRFESYQCSWESITIL